MVPSKIDWPIWGMMMSVGMISFPTSPQSEARAGRKQFIIYKRAREAGTGEGVWLWGMALESRRDRGFGGKARAAPGGRDRLRASNPCRASFLRLPFFRHPTVGRRQSWFSNIPAPPAEVY